MFSIKESVKYGWEKTKNNFWLVIALGVIMSVPSFIISFFDTFKKYTDSVSASWGFEIIIFLAQLASIFISIGFIKMFLRINDGEKPPLKDIFSDYGVFWKYLGASILYGLIVMGGLLLLIIPGIYWAIKYSFTTFIVIDTGSGPIGALKESGRITKNVKWKLIGFGIVAGLITLAGYIALFVGAYVTAPIALFASIYVYRKLSQTQAGLTETPASTASPQTV